MKIRKLIIKNFRGIKELTWALPLGNIFCLIGKGDSSKSTILEAIEYAFFPHWNLLLSDSDFYHCNTDNAITIEITVGDLIEKFLPLNKFGQYLRGWNPTELTLLDEPDDDLESVLTIRLTIEKDLEPKWRIISDRDLEGTEFRAADRNKVRVGLIGAYSERQLSWASGTALAKLTDDPHLNESLIEASRTARRSLDENRHLTLKNFDDAAQKSQAVAKILGVPVNHSYKAQLDLKSINIKIGGLALHDGDIPLRQLGLGSRRMLLCGIQKEGLEEGHITLFDEVEFGLEPHRITRLLKHIREDQSGQYFLTTHSPIVLRELTVKELYIVHYNDGIVQIASASSKELEEQNVQGKIRSSAEAFLAKKVMICEGATEIGFLRGYDDHRLNKGKDSFSYHGVALLDVGGASKIKPTTLAFKNLHYAIAVIADGDAPDKFSENDANELIGKGIAVKMWADKLCLEERAMLDLPWPSVLASVNLTHELGRPAHDNIQSQLQESLEADTYKWIDNQKIRQAIGKAANASQWFKDITRGDLWFKAIASAFEDDNFLKTDLAIKLEEISNWVEHD